MSDSYDHEIKSLSQEELELVLRYREKQKTTRENADFRLKVLETAYKYEQWLQQNSQAHSFSAFINQYGYQDSDGKVMHQHIKEVLSSLPAPE